MPQTLTQPGFRMYANAPSVSSARRVATRTWAVIWMVPSISFGSGHVAEQGSFRLKWLHYMVGG
jgi:hypothetical protein